MNEISCQEKLKKLHGDGGLGACNNFLMIAILTTAGPIAAQLLVNILLKRGSLNKGLRKSSGSY